MKNRFTHKRGYTIIETMISVSLFIVIVTLGMGAFMNANLIHKKEQNTRSLIDNMSFIMEDMARNLRTGYMYRCITDGSFNQSSISTPQSCGNGGAIAFEEAHGSTSSSSDQWVYKIESTDGGNTYNLSKSIDGGTTWTQLNPNEVVLESVSGFSVTGAEAPTSPGVGDARQPYIVIHLVGKINYKTVTTHFSLQTSVSQRLLDVAP